MTSNKKKALAAGGVGIVLAGWLGASIHAGSVAERELRAFAARPSSETGVRVRLSFNHIDTVIVTGGATSGCVRATVVDGMSLGYRMIVPEECVADREEGPHFAALYDIALKYGDVAPAASILDTLARMAGGKERS